MNFTQKQKILALMCKYPEKQWWIPPDFMKNNLQEYFIGYEASARLSELASSYPKVFASKKEGKYIARRLNIETMHDWLGSLPKDLRYIIHRSGLSAKMKQVSDEELLAKQNKVVLPWRHG